MSNRTSTKPKTKAKKGHYKMGEAAKAGGYKTTGGALKRYKKQHKEILAASGGKDKLLYRIGEKGKWNIDQSVLQRWAPGISETLYNEEMYPQNPIEEIRDDIQRVLERLAQLMDYIPGLASQTENAFTEDIVSLRQNYDGLMKKYLARPKCEACRGEEDRERMRDVAGGMRILHDRYANWRSK